MSDTLRRNAFYERSHLFMPGNNVVVAFQLIGKISAEELRTAVEKARKKHPLIGAHLEFDENQQAWFVTDNTPDIPIDVYPEKPNENWIQKVLSTYWEKFSITQGPLLKFLLIQGQNTSELAVIAQHAICDGLSLVYLLRDILQFLTNPELSIEPIDQLPTIAERYDLEGIKLHPLISKIVSKFNALWQSKHMVLNEEDLIPVHEVFSDWKVNAVFWHLGQQETEKFVNLCKKNGISVNSALYCAIITLQSKIQGNKEKFRRNIMMPINIRNFLDPPVGEEVGLYAGGEMFKLKVNPKSDFWKQAKKVDRKLKKRINPQGMFAQAKKMLLMDPSLMEARTMAFLGPMMQEPTEKYLKLVEILDSDPFLRKMKNQNAAGNIMMGSVLTNIGKLNIPEEYGHLKLSQVFFLPPSSPMAEKIIGVCTYKGILQGTLSFTEKNLSPEIAAEFAKSLVEFIKAQI